MPQRSSVTVGSLMFLYKDCAIALSVGKNIQRCFFTQDFKQSVIFTLLPCGQMNAVAVMLLILLLLQYHS